MRKVSEKCRRALSAILAAAMVLTSAPGTTMTAMAAEQTDAMETVVDSEDITVDDAASPDGEEKAALDGEDGTDGEDTGSTTQKLETPQFTMNPEDGKVANRGEASFSLTVPDNSQVYYVIGDADQGEDAVAEPSTSSNEYTSGTTVQVPAPDQYTEATVVVKAIAIPNGSDASASYTASEVATTTFTFAAYERVTLDKPEIILNTTEATNRAEDVTFTIEGLPTMDGAVVKYTLDGTDPIESALDYVSGTVIKVDAPNMDTEEKVTIKAAAVATDTEKYNNSEVVEATVTFAEKVETEAPAAPTITLKSGENTLENGEKVEFGTKVSMEIAAAEGTTIYYTKDGSDPTDKSEQYKEVVTLSSAKEEGETVTVKAIAVKDGKSSEAATVTVRFDGKKFNLTVESENFDGFTVELDEIPAGEENGEPLIFGDGHTVKVTKGAMISGRVQAEENYSLVSVVLGGTDWVQSEHNKVNLKNGFVMVASANVSKDQTLTVVTKAACDVKVVDKNGNEISKTAEGDDAGKYVVNPSTYTITATVKGSETAVAIDEATILVNNKANNKNKPEVKDNAVTLAVGSDLYGKDFEVQLKSKNVVVETVSFKAIPVLTKVTVKGVDKKGALTQNILSSEWYDVTWTPNTLTEQEVRAQLGVYSADSELVKASFGGISGNDKRLYLETTETATEKPVKVILYNKLVYGENGEEVTEEEINNREAAVATINVNVVWPAWTKNPLAVKYVDSTDTEIKVSVTAPAGLSYGTARYYYIFDVKDPSTVSGNIPAVSKYFVKEAEDGTKTYTLKVIDADAGKGAAKSFEVKAYLVRVTGVNEPADLDDENIVAKTAEAKSPLKCSTKAPYYADKISLKKGTTTIYSGQQDVQIATINYGKNTTYLTADAALVGVTDQDIIDGIDLKVEDGKVYATVGKEITPGKYTVKVTAEADADMKAAEATLPITVVAGISELYAVGSTDKIYLDTSRSGKGGKASVTVTYGSYNTENKPKSAKFIYTLGKVVEGEFVADAAPLGTNSKNKSYVTLDQKGNIAVDKTYVIKEDAADNTFAVQVKANDYKGNDVSDYVEFTVVKEAQTLGKLVLLGKDGKEILPEDVEKNTYAASALDGAQVAVLAKADATVDEESGKYADADIVDSNLYTVSVKGKGITVDGNGVLIVTNPAAKKLTITATTKDGGKKSVSLAIGQLAYDDVTKKNVRVAWKYYEDEDDKRTVLETDKTNELVSVDKYVLHSGETFDLQIVYDGDGKDGLNDINKFQNYTISVSGGAKVLYDYATYDPMLAKNQILGVMLTDPAEKITVTLKNGNDKNDKKVYVLQAADAAKNELAAPKITLDPKQALVAGNKKTQELTFTVKGDVPENADFTLFGADLKSQEFFGYDAIKDITYAAKDMKITVTFKPGAIEKAGSANVYFIMVVPGEDQSYSRSRLSNTVKITAVNMKKSFKLVDKYKMSAVDASKVAVAYKATGVEDVTVTNLYNENVKGQANKFTDLIGIGSYGASLELKQYAADQKISGYVEVEVTYDDGEEETIVSKVTVTLTKQGVGVNAYKAADVTLVKGKTTADEAAKMPVVIKAGKNEADVALAATTVTNPKGEVIEGITVKDVEDGKVYLDVEEFVAANKENGIKQDVQLKVVLVGANDVNTSVDSNKNAITLKFKIAVPNKMLYEDERTELTPTVTFSNDAPENRANDVTFEIATAKELATAVKAIYYTTDGTDPALNAKGNPANKSTKKYTKKVAVTAPDTNVEETVTVKALVVAKDQTTYKNATTSATVTFKAVEPKQLTTPKITFSNPLPKNRESITFTIETQAAEKDYIKGVYYTTDESEPALNEDGTLKGTTQEYNGTEATLTGPNENEAKLVWVKVLVVAKDPTTHTDVTNSATVTFAAATTEGGDTGSGDAGDGSETGN
jgi:hypothetical protein